jgi:hypothetical protein
VVGTRGGAADWAGAREVPAWISLASAEKVSLMRLSPAGSMDPG